MAPWALLCFEIDFIAFLTHLCAIDFLRAVRRDRKVGYPLVRDGPRAGSASDSLRPRFTVVICICSTQFISCRESDCTYLTDSVGCVGVAW